MNENKTTLLTAFVIVIVLLAFIGSVIMTEVLPSGSMMDSGTIVGINWMWLPFLFLIILTAILSGLFLPKKNDVGLITLPARSMIALDQK